MWFGSWIESVNVNNISNKTAAKYKKTRLAGNSPFYKRYTLSDHEEAAVLGV